MGHLYLHKSHKKGHAVTVPGQHAMMMYGQCILNVSTGQRSSVSEGEGLGTHLNAGVKQENPGSLVASIPYPNNVMSQLKSPINTHMKYTLEHSSLIPS